MEEHDASTMALTPTLSWGFVAVILDVSELGKHDDRRDHMI